MSQILFENIKKGIGKITFNDPDTLNAMSEKMAVEFSALIKKLKNDSSDLRAIIITGAGRAFSAGGDLEMLQKKTTLKGEENRLKMLEFYDSFLSIRDLGIPLIAAINGHAVGAGLCLASACDIRIAHENAKLGVTFTKLGLHPGMGGTYFIPKLVGTSAAIDLMITGRMLTADEGLRLGLVSEVTKDDVVQKATEKADQILECGPEAVRQVLETLRNGQKDLKTALAREAMCQAVNYASSEYAEGVKAIREKRKANF